VAQATVKLLEARMKQWMICSNRFKRTGQMKKMASHFTAEAGTDVTNNVLTNNEAASKFS
jgi:hypothetical protein